MAELLLRSFLVGRQFGRSRLSIILWHLVVVCWFVVGELLEWVLALGLGAQEPEALWLIPHCRNIFHQFCQFVIHIYLVNPLLKSFPRLRTYKGPVALGTQFSLQQRFFDINLYYWFPLGGWFPSSLRLLLLCQLVDISARTNRLFSRQLLQISFHISNFSFQVNELIRPLLLLLWRVGPMYMPVTIWDLLLGVPLCWRDGRFLRWKISIAIALVRRD